MCVTGFHGLPVMLSDGSIVDSASLPPNAIEEYPVTFTGASLVESSAARSAPEQFDLGQTMTASATAPMDSQAGIEADNQGLDSTREASIQGHPVTFSRDTMNTGGAPASGSYLTSTGMDSIAGHPISFSGGRMLDAGPLESQYEPVMASRDNIVGTDNAGSTLASGGSQYRFDPALRSIQGHPLATSGSSVMDSAAITSAPGSIRGRPPTSGGLSRHMSRNDPTIFSGNTALRSAPGSTRGSVLDYSSDSVRRLAQDFPMTFSDVSMTDVSAARLVAESTRQEAPTSYALDSENEDLRQLPTSNSVHTSRHTVQEYPLTFSGGTFMDSGALRSAPGSVRAYPVTQVADSGSEATENPLNAISMRSSGALQGTIMSVRGHPVTMSGRSFAPSSALGTQKLDPSQQGRSRVVELPDGSYLPSSYLTSEALQGSGDSLSVSQRPYGGEGELESLPEGSVLDSLRDESVAAHPLTGSFFTASGIQSLGAVRSAPGSVRDRRRRMDMSTSDSTRAGTSRPTTSSGRHSPSTSTGKPSSERSTSSHVSLALAFAQCTLTVENRY